MVATNGPVAAFGLSLAAFLLSWWIVRGAIAYAHRRGMLDQPGQRRSHKLPTPRGGGIGIVAAVLLLVLPCGLWAMPGYAWSVSAALELATVLVAAAGWWDDHRSLPVLPRLGAQLLASSFFASAVLYDGLSWWWLPVLLIAGVWSVNLHNFMDGIDGLLAQHTIFVGMGLSLIAMSAKQPALAATALGLAAAALGFWCYNRAPARIFMGDVGSGSVGLLIFALSALLWRVSANLLWPALILSSAFVVDASLTLLVRIWRGRRWYAPHREHLYQWMVRSGYSHARTGWWYLGWNLLISAPLAGLARAWPVMALPLSMVAYLAAALVWYQGKRYCMRRVTHRTRYVVT